MKSVMIVIRIRMACRKKRSEYEEKTRKTVRTNKKFTSHTNYVRFRWFGEENKKAASIVYFSNRFAGPL